MKERQPIACPKCGDTKWWALETYRAVDRLDLEAGKPAVSWTDNVSYRELEFEGWYCDKFEHQAPEKINDELNDLHATTA